MKVDSSYERGRPGWCDNNVQCIHTLHFIWSKLVPMQYVKVWIAHYSQSVSVLCATVCRMWSVMLPPPPRPGQCSAWHYATRLSLPFLPFLFQSTLSRVRGKMYFVLTFTLAPFDVQKIYANMFQSVYKLWCPQVQWLEDKFSV